MMYSFPFRKMAALLYVAVLFSLSGFAQTPHKKLRVLFLGNSYTYVNNLPQLLAQVAQSAGDTLIYDSNTIGGYVLKQHYINATSLAKIAQGNWDFVVLQEQSQQPAFPINQVQEYVFPYAKKLDSLVNVANPCTETMFYMTWGRKNGDAFNCANYPPICTYLGMDSLLRARYTMMANDNNAVLSPVGAVWRNIRANFPNIELYQSDESHPSPAGSYAAACCFYSALFRKSPTDISTNYSLSAADAANIRTAAKAIVFDSLLTWNIGKYDTKAAFSYQIAVAQPTVAFQNQSINADAYLWHFGDGDSSTLAQPTHLYADSTATYEVRLIATRCQQRDTLRQVVQITGTNTGVSAEKTARMTVSPQPANDVLRIQSEVFEAQPCSLRLRNVLGQIVWQRAASAEKTQEISVSRFAAGAYWIEISAANGILATQKVMIE